eukprot:maker-scaffold_4-snap-gene-19.4-mRNA-1 protein AED:0.02 eAED:0.02 QI:344/1/1/1/1/1/3/106/107
MTSTLPAVNASFMDKFQGGQVSLIGRVEIVQGSDVTVLSTDGVKISVSCEDAVALDIMQLYEFIGTVKNSQSFDAYSFCGLSDGFDQSLYNDSLVLTQGKYSQIFGI